MDELTSESSVQQEMREIEEWKRRRQTEQKWQRQPSKAPLDSQESCIVC